jgi:hypothetical protein
MAMVGEPLPAIERALIDDARTPLSRAVDDALYAYFTDSTLLLLTASAYTEVGKPAWAARVFGDVLADAALSHRDTGYFRARRSARRRSAGSWTRLLLSGRNPSGSRRRPIPGGRWASRSAATPASASPAARRVKKPRPRS